MNACNRAEILKETSTWFLYSLRPFLTRRGRWIDAVGYTGKNFDFVEQVLQHLHFQQAVSVKTAKQLFVDKNATDMNRLIDTGKKYGMEININKSQVTKISRSNESLQIEEGNREISPVVLPLASQSC